MNQEIIIVDLNEKNITKYDLFCNKTRKGRESYERKIEWLKKQFPNGLKFKLLITKLKTKFKSIGFIEYIPGKYSWRGINAHNYLVIHCLWISQQFQGQGLGTHLLSICEEDAKQFDGIAVLTSKDTWLPLQNYFKKMDLKKLKFITRQ